MSEAELDALVKIGKLKIEPASRSEYIGLVSSAGRRLADARDEGLSAESRFDLAYNAAHGLALASLRRKGYRPDGRYLVFQVLPYTVGLDASIWRVLSKCHDQRNLAEYEGHNEVDMRLLADLIRCATVLEVAVKKLTVPD
jgi:hypothetical protein